jgi:ligand-binding sensor protein
MQCQLTPSTEDQVHAFQSNLRVVERVQQNWSSENVELAVVVIDATTVVVTRLE